MSFRLMTILAGMASLGSCTPVAPSGRNPAASAAAAGTTQIARPAAATAPGWFAREFGYHIVYLSQPQEQPQATITAGDAARPFINASRTADDAQRSLDCLTAAVYYEARSEPVDGQRAVAQVVLNRVRNPSFPSSVCGVVFQGSERSTGCQFTFTCDGSLARRPAAFWWDRARHVARAALAGAVYAPIGLATNYHTLQVHPSWSDSLVAVATIGAHRFFRLPGLAGQRVAFRAAYLGGEPAAMPHPRVLTPATDSDPDPVVLARAFAATAPHGAPLGATTAKVQAPVYSAEVEARGGDALFRADNLPAGGALAPELQRSGQWLQHP